MNQPTLLVAAVVLAAAASATTTALLAPPDATAAAPARAATAGSGEALAARLEALARRQDELERTCDGIAQAAARPEPAALDQGAVAAAVARWLEAHEVEVVATSPDADGAPAPGSLEAGLRDTPIEELVDNLLDDSIPFGEREALWRQLGQAGRLDEVVAELEKMVALDPQDPDLHTDLGYAYLQQLFLVGSGPAAGVLATKADQAFDAALAVDADHWEARFLKAVSLSNWPAFLGKQGAAIEQFEKLASIQEQTTAKPEQVQTYLYLGNMYMETGQKEKAIEAWKRGLERFPDSDELRRQLELAGGGGR